jgi:hypothetical protein
MKTPAMPAPLEPRIKSEIKQRGTPSTAVTPHVSQPKALNIKPMIANKGGRESTPTVTLSFSM